MSTRNTQQQFDNNSITLLLKAIKKQNAVYENVLSQMAIENNKSKTENRRNRLKFTKKEILRMPTHTEVFLPQTI